jgi:diguanylate cyclase (GGDEF)-like protein
MASEAIAVFDALGRVYDVNLKLCELTGYTRETMLREDFDWSCCVDPDDLPRIQESLAQLTDAQLASPPVLRLEIRLLHRDDSGSHQGDRRWPVLASYTRLERRFDWPADRLLVVMTDIRALKALEAELRTMSFQDGLTGLYNKRFWEQTLAMACAQRDGMLGLIVVDVNYLKLVNDTLGHDAGDMLLQRTAGLLKATCRTEDCCARTGGDEFCILLRNATEQEVHRVVERLEEAMDKERQKHEVLPFSLAVGSAWSQTPCMPQVLFQQADQAMYRDKVLRKQQDQVENLGFLDPRCVLPRAVIPVEPHGIPAPPWHTKEKAS